MTTEQTAAGLTALQQIINRNWRLASSLLLAALGASSGRGATTINAPAVLPTSIVHYTTYNLGHTTSRVVLYDAPGTYTEIAVTAGGLGIVIPVTGDPGSVATTLSSPPHHGTFTYSVDPQDPGHATIVYDGGHGALPNDELYFVTSARGSSDPLNWVTAGSSRSFSIYALRSGAGGINLSNRSTLVAGDSTITGFVVGGAQATWVLVRAVGAGLGKFGVSPTVTQPSFTVYDEKQTIVGQSAPWGVDPNLLPGYKAIASRIGAFPLADNSDEGVLLLPLQPGAYTAVFKASTSGQILCETYILPYSSP